MKKTNINNQNFLKKFIFYFIEKLHFDYSFFKMESLYLLLNKEFGLILIKLYSEATVRGWWIEQEKVI
ncbi:hypothetical protein COC96_19520 [Bacillus cereus]|uniref:hypothetical protein n=1 Tax=Bacillus mycoides TaxID=1405 RepID=UPI000BFC60BB|nr:hypothetical protein [Bacillus mycoides]PGT15813.1 hypothetical protein COC96_19520 [Bacillus cereus]